MNESPLVPLAPPRFETAPAMLIAGLDARYTFGAIQAIPAQWARFAPWIGRVPGQVSSAAYGVCHASGEQGSFNYLAGVEVRSPDGLPPDLALVRVPAGRYAVFTHDGPVSALPGTVSTIWNSALPELGLTVPDTPNFERYSEDFDPGRGTGTIEVWVPVAD